MFRADLTPGISTGSLFATVMDKAMLAAAAAGGNALQGSEASGSTESSGSAPAEGGVSER